jgi:putative acetyltransferase
MNISNIDSPFTIVPYAPKYREAFERLNLAWLQAYSLIEPADIQQLKNPQLHILSKGGEIFFATKDDVVVGTCAAIRRSDTTFELAKLSVDPAVLGLGLGRLLSEAVINFARQAGALNVVLTSNSSLKRAIGLYESLGFIHTAAPKNIQYDSANVFMSLMLSNGT